MILGKTETDVQDKTETCEARGEALRLDPKLNFFMLTAGFQKFTAAFWLSQKNWKHTFSAKNSHVTKFIAKCVARNISHFCQCKEVEKSVHNNC